MQPLLSYLFPVLLGLAAGVLINAVLESLSVDRGGEENGRFPATFVWLLRTARKQAPQLPQTARLQLATEWLVASLFAAAWSLFQTPLSFTLSALLIVFLVLIAVIDIRHRLIFNKIIYPGILLSLLTNIFLLKRSLPDLLLGGAIALVLFFIVAILPTKGIGGGDIKLATFLGVTFGFPHIFTALLIGTFIGALVAILLLLKFEWMASRKMAYGPFLCLGGLLALFLAPILPF